MLTIQIRNWENNVVAVINDIFSLQVEDEVNKGNKLKLTFPAESRLQKKPLKKWYRISVVYGLKIWQMIQLFDWYITDVIVELNWVEIQAENRLSYLQNRIVRVAKNYSNKEISYVVNDIFNYMNGIFPLPVSLWINDCTTKITKNFDKGTSFYDILKYCWESEKDLVVRTIDGKLDVSKNTGKVLDWVWEYDAQNVIATNLSNRSWKDTIDEFYSYIQNQNWNLNNAEWNEEMGLIFEKYEWEATLSLPSGKPIPSVNVSRDTDWWDFNVWDRKEIRLFTGYDWLVIEYLGLIQKRKVDINWNWGIKAEIKISEEYRAETNVLDLILINLRKK